MGRIIPSIADNHQDINANLDITDIEAMFKWYGRLKNNSGSVEGLESIAGNIAIAFGDFVGRIGSNIKVSVSGFFKDIKRSALRITMSSNKLGMMRVFGADYTQLKGTVCSSFPFTVNCDTVGKYCNDTFTIIDMNKRVVSLIEEYLHLSGLIKTGNINLCVAKMNRINELNMKSQLNVKSTLSQMIAVPSHKNFSTFGEVFNSVKEFHDAVNLTLKCADELEVAMKVDTLTDHLYKAYDKLKDSISHASTTELDLSKLTGLATALYDTGELIESYAMLVKEYHHLEYWLSTTSEACLKTMNSN